MGRFGSGTDTAKFASCAKNWPSIRVKDIIILQGGTQPIAFRLLRQAPSTERLVSPPLDLDRGRKRGYQSWSILRSWEFLTLNS